MLRRAPCAGSVLDEETEPVERWPVQWPAESFVRACLAALWVPECPAPPVEIDVGGMCCACDGGTVMGEIGKDGRDEAGCERYDDVLTTSSSSAIHCSVVAWISSSGKPMWLMRISTMAA